MTGPGGGMPRPGRSDWDQTDTAVALVLALAAGATYLFTLAPSVVAGNSGEYQYAVPSLGIVHSTGYPLYTLLGKLFTLIPVGSVAYRMNLFSAVAAAASVAAVYGVLRALVRRRALCVTAALAFGLARSFWGTALIAEVHSLNVLFVALDVLLLLQWRRAQHGRTQFAWSKLRALALVFGLSLAHHRTAMLLLPGAAVFLLWTAWPALRQAASHRRQFAAHALLTVLIGLMPLALYAYIPLRGAQLLADGDPRVTDLYRGRAPEAVLRGMVTAHYTGGVNGFLNLVSGRDYSGDVGIGSIDQLGERLNVWGSLLIEQFSAVGLLLAAIGLFALLRRDVRTGVLFVLGYLGFALFAVVYVGHGQIWYYFLPSYVFVVGLMGVALDVIWNLLENRSVNPPESATASTRLVPPYALFAALTLALPLGMAQVNGPLVDMSRHHIDQWRAKDALSRQIEQGAVLMGPWDLATPVRYYQFVEGVRPDLVMIHGDASQGSGRRIMKRAIELGRPFYVLETGSLPPALAELSGHWVELVPVVYSGSVPASGPPADFGGRIELLATESPVEAEIDRRAGAAVPLTFYWRCLSDLNIDYRLFAHLIAPDGTTRARIDEAAGSIYYPPSQWQIGQTFRDDRWLVLGPDAPAGSYRLEVGLYDSEGGERLRMVGGGDALPIGAINVMERGGT